MTTFHHSISGRTFTAYRGAGRFGSSSRDGVWDDGTPGTIFPDEILRGAVRAWTLRWA